MRRTPADSLRAAGVSQWPLVARRFRLRSGRRRACVPLYGPTMDSVPYTRDELAALPEDAWPQRGVYCQRCSQFIPQFVDVTADDIARLSDAHMGARMKFVRDATGCSPRWAKIWALHRDGGHDTPPCPECGEPLRTELAKQCLACGADWH